MSEGNQPFTDLVTKDKREPGVSRSGWIAAGAVAVIAVAGLACWMVYDNKQRDVESLQSKLDETKAGLTTVKDEIQKDKDQLASLQSKIAVLEQEKEQAEHMAKGLEEEMRSDLESKDVTISKLQGKLTVNILDRVMFDSGESILKTDGGSVLQKIAAILVQHPELKIQVIGHTDNVPIHSKYPSNWELSVARALSAVHFLTEKAGVDPRRVGAVGYGEFRPIADNSTAEGRARNRRIAITILPDEFAVADAVPVAGAIPPVDALPKTGTAPDHPQLAPAK